MFFLPEDLHSELNLSSLQLVSCRLVAEQKVFPYIIKVQIIYFLVLWDQWAHSVQFEKNRIPLKPELVGGGGGVGRGQCCTIILLHMN